MTLYLILGMGMFALGLHGVFARPHSMRKIIAVNVTGTGVFLVFIATAARTAGEVPDPVPQAMVLTGIVVSVCATGLALVLADRLQAATGRTDLDEPEEGS
jgi:multicomponent Na+:H+ antiporter subunit C